MDSGTSSVAAAVTHQWEPNTDIILRGSEYEHSGVAFSDARRFYCAHPRGFAVDVELAANYAISSVAPLLEGEQLSTPQPGPLPICSTLAKFEEQKNGGRAGCPA